MGEIQPKYAECCHDPRKCNPTTPADERQAALLNEIRTSECPSRIAGFSKKESNSSSDMFVA